MSKNIIICFDGTGNRFNGHNTNVVHTAARVFKEGQAVCYDPGVGTFSLFNKARPSRGNSLSALLGRVFGYGLDRNIFEGYKFLMREYSPGDRLFIMGFSRGAYAARALAGVLHKCGLLDDLCYNLIPTVADIYFQPDNDDLAQRFKQTFSKSCKVHFVGVWDTIKSLGYFFGKRFPNARLNVDISYGYHAVSIDENREKLQVCLWDENNKVPHQVIEQVWFPGVHTDIGGGYADHGLSDIALQWLLEKAHQCGLILKENWRDHIVPKPLARMHNERKKYWYWKLWPVYTRPIAEGALIHKSTLTRMAHDESYKPKLPEVYSVVE